MLKVDGQHRGRGAVAMVLGAALIVGGVLIAGPFVPASDAGQAALASLGIALALAGSLLFLLGSAKVWLAGRDVTWPRAFFGSALVVLALVLGFAVYPSWWQRSMHELGPEWAKDLVSVVYLVALFAAGTYLMRERTETPDGTSGLSAYGRQLVKGGSGGR